MSLKRTKATAIVNNVLGTSFNQEIIATLSVPGCFFSLIMDESTDKATIKQCAFTIIYFCSEQNKVVTKFFDSVEMKEATAIALYECLKNVLIQKNIPLTNFVGFSYDTTNVMFGQFHSVVALLKKDLPEIVSIMLLSYDPSFSI